MSLQDGATLLVGLCNQRAYKNAKSVFKVILETEKWDPQQGKDKITEVFKAHLFMD